MQTIYSIMEDVRSIGPNFMEVLPMASKRKTGTRTSTAVVRGNQTILQTAVKVMLSSGNIALTPSEIAQIGVIKGVLRVPRGRTSGYLTQLLQSELYNNYAYSVNPVVDRVSWGMYEVI
jgi:hypothetical protein